MIDRFGVLLVLAAATACSAQQTDGRKRDTVSVPNFRSSLRLSLTIRTEQQTYRLGDKVQLQAQLTNTGSGTLFLFDDVCWNPGNFLTLQVFAMSGKEVSVPLTYLRDCLPPPPHQNDTSNFFRLDPQTFYGVIEKFDVRELVPESGDYDIVVHYQGALSADWIAKYGGEKIAALPVWTREQPLLTSNRLRISIRP
jgi:hypothetical protein